MMQALEQRGHDVQAFLVDRCTDEGTAPVMSEVKRQAPGGDQWELSYISYVQKNGLQWKDAPTVYGLLKRLCNRLVR